MLGERAFLTYQHKPGPAHCYCQACCYQECTYGSFLPRHVVLTIFAPGRRDFPGCGGDHFCRSAAVSGRTRPGYPSCNRRPFQVDRCVVVAVMASLIPGTSIDNHSASAIRFSSHRPNTAGCSEHRLSWHRGVSCPSVSSCIPYASGISQSLRQIGHVI